MERVTYEDLQEMARKMDQDYIDSLNMIGEGDPNYPAFEKEEEQIQGKTEEEKPPLS